MSDEQHKAASILSFGGGEGVIKIRLDTSKLLNDIELFLKGLRLVPVINEQGQTEIATEKVGEPLMNDKGLQCVLMTIGQTINSHGVQGNWKPEYFVQFIAEADKNFSSDVWVNRERWEVDLENYNVICNAFMNLLQQFASRIIENRERESYGASMKTTESVVQNTGRASIFGG